MTKAQLNVLHELYHSKESIPAIHFKPQTLGYLATIGLVCVVDGKALLDSKARRMVRNALQLRANIVDHEQWKVARFLFTHGFDDLDNTFAGMEEPKEK